MTEQVATPFSVEQVTNLNKHQTDGRFHPFTCGGSACPVTHSTLVATVRGWICPYCDYTQGWAHGFMATPKPLPAPDTTHFRSTGNIGT